MACRGHIHTRLTSPLQPEANFVPSRSARNDNFWLGHASRNTQLRAGSSPASHLQESGCPPTAFFNCSNSCKCYFDFSSRSGPGRNCGRSSKLQADVDGVRRKVEKPPKDLWDKVAAVSGLVSNLVDSHEAGDAVLTARLAGVSQIQQHPWSLIDLIGLRSRASS
jgi:hypothetical protein